MDQVDHLADALGQLPDVGPRECQDLLPNRNGKMLLEQPGPIDWPAAFLELNDIRYDGWYVYETAHDSTADCIEDTKKNNAFLQKHVRMPLG